MHARQDKTCSRVVERGIRPLHRVVAGSASGRQSGCLVGNRGIRVVVIGLVTRHAGRIRDVVIIVHVTIGTLPRRRRVRSCQREPGIVVIEDRIVPRRCAVALITGLREIRRHVIRIIRALIVLQVTGDAGLGADRVIVIGVAIRAGARRHRVQARQREPGRTVVEHAIGPLLRIVALLASGGERSRHVIDRRSCVVVIGLMTRDASRIRDVVIIVRVTIGALARRHGV